MQGYKITKYNPLWYGASGSYTKEEWTSISDIGKTFDGAIFTLAEYEEVEKSYLAAIRLFADAVGIDQLQVCDVETYDETSERILEDGQCVSLSSAIEICREMLREGPIWCRLEKDRDFYVHIGHDYYMYIGVNAVADVSQAVNSVRQLGLYVEENWPSPYMREES